MNKMYLSTKERAINLVIEPIGGLLKIAKGKTITIEWPSGDEADIPTIFPLENKNDIMIWTDSFYLKVSDKKEILFNCWPDEE